LDPRAPYLDHERILDRCCARVRDLSAESDLAYASRLAVSRIDAQHSANAARCCPRSDRVHSRSNSNSESSFVPALVRRFDLALLRSRREMLSRSGICLPHLTRTVDRAARQKLLFGCDLSGLLRGRRSWFRKSQQHAMEMEPRGLCNSGLALGNRSRAD